MRKKPQRNLLIVTLVLCMLVSILGGCTRELTEEQSAAQIALQSAVTYYETTNRLTHWEELVALAAANRADGIGINWGALKLPQTQTFTGGTSAKISPTNYTAGIMSSILKGEDSTQMVNDLLLMQDPTTGIFDPVYPGQHIWAMITLNVAAGKDAYDYDKAVTHLLTFQKADGGFGYSLTASESNVELTGIASVALAPYYSKHKKTTQMKALASFYKEKQTASGGYEGFDGETPSTIAMAIWGLTALDRPLPTAKKDGPTPVDALLAFQNEDGSFRSTLDGDHVFDSASTRLATIALCDIINDMNTYVLLAADAESYRIQNISGPAITLAIDYPDNTQQPDVSTPFTIEENSNALDAIVLYGKVTETPVTLKGGAANGYIYAIDGMSAKSAGETSGWIYKINGETPAADASHQVLHEGDVLTWIFTTESTETIME